MRSLKKLELGLMFWATGDAERDIAFVRSFGLNAGQLGFGGELALDGMAADWTAALRNNPDFRIETAVCSYVGEDYTDIPHVEQTVGLVPVESRAERIARTLAVAEIAAQLEILNVACHIGTIGTASEEIEVSTAVRDICDNLSRRNQNFVLETGQEIADALLIFMRDVNRPNLKINFDPANMILYGTGDPIEAVRTLSEHVVSVHCKDGVAPDPQNKGSLGTEQPLGSGQVDFPAFLKTLHSIGYQGILSIEREEPDLERRNRDIRHAVTFLRTLL